MMVKERGKEGTNRQDASVAEHRSILRTRVRHWEHVQALYMPGLHQLCRDLEAAHPKQSNDV